jgi:hypothetical protein
VRSILLKLNIFVHKPKGLTQVVRALVLVAFPLDLRIEFPRVQTVPWGYSDLICVKEVLYMSLRFIRQRWVYEVALP